MRPLPDLRGRTALVTGASAGIGRATAAALARAGARTLMLCRDPERGERARAEIAEQTGGDLELVLCDLSDQAAVRATGRDLAARLGALHLLVNNAGTSPRERELTADGVELGFAVNVVGPWQLTSHLAPLLQASAPARVVNLAGIYHRRGELQLGDLSWSDRDYRWMQAGCDTQQARVLLTRAWARRLEGSGVQGSEVEGSGVEVFAVHPGAVLTDAQKEAPWWAQALVHTVLRPGFVGPDRGADAVLHAALADHGAPTGCFFDELDVAPVEGGSADDGLGEQLWAALEALVRHPAHQPPGMPRW